MWRSIVMVWMLVIASAWACAEELVVWSSSAQEWVSLDRLIAQLAPTRYILVGEVHDNELHHQRQLALLERLQLRGRRVLALEIFDRDDQGWLASKPSLEEIGERVSARGWDWGLYRALVNSALDWGWPLQAANLSRSDAMRVARGEVALPAEVAARLGDAGRQALLQDLVDSHCGHLNHATASSVLRAQQARDAAMAAVLQEAWQRWQLPVVLIAGNAHVRRDYGVPVYLDAASVVTVAMTEQSSAERTGEQGREVWDFIWPATQQQREDPCAAFASHSAAPNERATAAAR